MGDVLLAVPALRALRARAPADELIVAAQGRIGALLVSLGIVDRTVAFDTLGIESLFAAEAPSERLRRLIEGARVVSWFGSADADYARRLRALAPGAIVASPTAPAGRNVWEHLVETVRGSAERPAPSARVLDAHAGDGWRQPIDAPPALVAAGRRALVAAGWDGARPPIMLHPGAGSSAKRWPVEAFAEVARALVRAHDTDLVVHAGPADHAVAAALRAALDGRGVSLVEPSLDTLAGAIRHAALWLGNDSGVSHLAAAVGAPTAVLFTAANVAWRPWARNAAVRIVDVENLSPSDVDAVVADAAALLDARRDPLRHEQAEPAAGARRDR